MENWVYYPKIHIIFHHRGLTTATVETWNKLNGVNVFTCRTMSSTIGLLKSATNWVYFLRSTSYVKHRSGQRSPNTPETSIRTQQGGIIHSTGCKTNNAFVNVQKIRTIHSDYFLYTNFRSEARVYSSLTRRNSCKTSRKYSE